MEVDFPKGMPLAFAYFFINGKSMRKEWFIDCHPFFV